VWFLAALTRQKSFNILLTPVVVVMLMAGLAGRLVPMMILVFEILGAALWWLRSRTDERYLGTAGLLLWWLLTTALVLSIPHAAYILVVPLASVLLLAVFRQYIAGLQAGMGQLLSHFAGSVIPLLLLAPLVSLLYLALGVFAPQIPMLLLGLILMLLMPLTLALARPAHGALGLAMMMIGVLILLPVLLLRSPDSRHPQSHELFLAVDAEQQRSYWASTDPRPLGWVHEVLGESPDEAVLEDIIPQAKGVLWSQEANIAPPGAGELRLVDDQVEGDQRLISLQLNSPIKAEYISLLFAPGVEYISASANGLPVKAPGLLADKWWRWRWFGLPEGGGKIDLTLPADQPFSVQMIEVSYQMPETEPPRPPDSMRKKDSFSDSTVIYQRLGPF
jgi:hypothetical protein